MSKTRTAEIQTEINELMSVEVCVGHNEGTYGGVEAARKCGSGDPQFASRNEYETVGGEKRSTGPSADRMPGYMQYGGKARLAEYRQQLAALRAELKSAR
jgi:hypothetical protein